MLRWGEVLRRGGSGVVVLVVLGASAAATRVVRGHPRAPLKTRELRNWRPIAAAGRRVGGPAAFAATRVTVTEFGDYQCPACGAVDGRLRRLVTRYPRDVSVVFRHYPLSDIHPLAAAAAQAAECAGRVGHFEAFHHALYSDQGNIGRRSWVDFAERSGITDTLTFRRCLESGAMVAAVRSDVAAGDAIGIIGTPTLLVNGTLVTGAVEEEQLRRLVEAALVGGGR